MKLIKDIMLRFFQLFDVDYGIVKNNKQLCISHNHVIEVRGYFNLYDDFNSEVYAYGRHYDEIQLCGALP